MWIGHTRRGQTLVTSFGCLQNPQNRWGIWRKISTTSRGFGSLSLSESFFAASPADAPTHASAWHSFDCGWSFGRGPCCRCWWAENSMGLEIVWWTLNTQLATPNAPCVIVRWCHPLWGSMWVEMICHGLPPVGYWVTIGQDVASGCKVHGVCLNLTVSSFCQVQVSEIATQQFDKISMFSQRKHHANKFAMTSPGLLGMSSAKYWTKLWINQGLKSPSWSASEGVAHSRLLPTFVVEMLWCCCQCVRRRGILLKILRVRFSHFETYFAISTSIGGLWWWWSKLLRLAIWRGLDAGLARGNGRCPCGIARLWPWKGDQPFWRFWWPWRPLNSELRHTWNMDGAGWYKVIADTLSICRKQPASKCQVGQWPCLSANACRTHFVRWKNIVQGSTRKGSKKDQLSKPHFVSKWLSHVDHMGFKKAYLLNLLVGSLEKGIPAAGQLQYEKEALSFEFAN